MLDLVHLLAGTDVESEITLNDQSKKKSIYGSNPIHQRDQTEYTLLYRASSFTRHIGVFSLLFANKLLIVASAPPFSSCSITSMVLVSEKVETKINL